MDDQQMTPPVADDQQTPVAPATEAPAEETATPAVETPSEEAPATESDEAAA
ncbi:MAG: hypothetical protein ABIG71_00755 [Candidatus Uhrbacteria bacterium]